MRLAQDSEVDVRSVVARFEYVPASVLDFLARDPDAGIRFEVTRNLNTGKDTLQRLSKDPYPDVANSALIALQRLAGETP